MQDKFNSVAGSSASLLIANVAFDEAEVAPLTGRDGAFDFLEIPAVPGGKIIETHHVLIKLQKSLSEIAANEAGGPGNQPHPRGVDKVRAYLLIARHSRHMRNPASLMAFRSNADLTSIKTPFFFNRPKSSGSGIAR